LRCHESPLYKVRYEDRSLGIEDDLPVKPKTRYSEEGNFSMSKMTAKYLFDDGRCRYFDVPTKKFGNYYSRSIITHTTGYY
jgi:hypothetical protein